MQESRLDKRILCPLIMVILALCAHPAAWGGTAAICGDTATTWTFHESWGLPINCYPQAGVCSEPDWFVTIEPLCGITLNANPSLATLTLRGSISGDSPTRDISVSGTTRLEGGGIFNVGNLFAMGPLEINAPHVFLSPTTLQSLSTATMSGTSNLSGTLFQNDGSFHKEGVATTSTISAVFNSPGTIEVEAGTLKLTGGGVASSLVSVHPLGVLEFGGSYEIAGSLASDGTVRVDKNTAVVDVTGSWNTGLTEILEGILNLPSASTSQSVTMSYGILTGDLSIGNLDWTGGTMAAPGTTRIYGTADILDDFLDPRLDGRMLVVDPGATVNVLSPLPASVAGNGIWGFNGASVVNRGTVTVVDGIPLFTADPATASFENDGLFEKSGANTATVQWEFLNRGTVHVLDGQLEFVDGYVQSVNPSTLTVPATQLSGALIGDVAPLVDIQDGFLKGYGAVEAPVLCTGVISPGDDSINQLTFEDTLTLGPGSSLEFELAAAGGGGEGRAGEGLAHDSILVFDDLVLDGDLLVTFVNGFENGVQPGDTFDVATVLSANAIQGQLAGQPSGSQLLTADGHGFFTVEYGPGASFPDRLRLTNYQPATPNPAGSVPDGDAVPGVPLRIDKATGSEITLTWGASCAVGDTDYEIYQGEIGNYYSHVKMDPCSTAGATTATFDPPSSVGTYYLVVPANATNEGSYGLRSDDTERPQPLHPADRCKPQQIAAVCP